LRGSEVKNISLIKVTFIVLALALVSSLISANDVLPKNISTVVPPSNVLFEQLDLDKNSSLNLLETEVHKLIHNAFTKIDSNDDATISKVELSEFIK